LIDALARMARERPSQARPQPPAQDTSVISALALRRSDFHPEQAGSPPEFLAIFRVPARMTLRQRLLPTERIDGRTSEFPGISGI
jgi:hypothetical protein